ncbi:MAG: LysR family transcriptional regulator [Spirochaetaceae bacterium]|nr:LysR family transcriptional regulator [Spirochaetaceae bacterium]
MQIESLKLFCDVVQLSSFSKAAKTNGVTQSTVSQTINHLEKHLNVLLIDRSQRPWKLTEEGQIFHDGCKNIVDDFQQLESRMKKTQEEMSSVVRVASIYSAGLRYMKNSVSIFTSQNTKAEINLKYLPHNDVYKNVLNDEVDFGIVSFPKPQRELIISDWKVEQMILICPPDHRLSRQKLIAPQQVSGENFIGFSKNMEIRKHIDRFLKQREINIETILEFDNIESIKRAVEIGTGITILPEPTIEQERKNKTLVGVPFTNNDFVRPMAIIRRRGKKINQTAIDFIEFLKKESE